MVPNHMARCAIWTGMRRVGRIEATEVVAEGYCARCAVQFLVSIFQTPDVKENEYDAEPSAFVRYILKDTAAPGAWKVGEEPEPGWPFIIARLCARDAVSTAAPKAAVDPNGLVPDKIIGHDIFAGHGGTPFSTKPDDSLSFAGEDDLRILCECEIDILCMLDQATRDREQRVATGVDGLLETGRLGNFYQRGEVRQAVGRLKSPGFVQEDNVLSISDLGRKELRERFDRDFERMHAPQLPPRSIGFRG